MNSFTDFESAFLAALPQERSELRSLQGEPEAQLSAWIEHLFRDYLGYTHFKEINREGGAPIGAKGTKQLFPDLRINVLDNGLIFVECKRLGRLEGPKGLDERKDAESQLKSYIRAHIDQAALKPKMVLGVVTDGNRWVLLGLNRTNEFHTIAEWAFLTDDPRLIAQHLWLLAKPALAQPISALVEFLARRTLADVLKDNARWLTRKVNEKLPDGTVSEELIARWLRDVFADPGLPPRLLPTDAAPPAVPGHPQPASPTASKLLPPPEADTDRSELPSRRVGLNDLLGAGLLSPHDVLLVEGVDGRQQQATLTADGKIEVAGEVFDTVSPAALRALALAGKTLKAVNGWATFRVLRNGNAIGTLLQIRDRYDRESSPAEPASDDGSLTAAEPNLAVQLALEQLKPLLVQLPEFTVNASRTMASLFAGKLVVGYVHPRKKGMPRLRVYVGATCPEWATPDPSYLLWCFVEDWKTNLERVVALLKEAPRKRAEDLAAGHDTYLRRTAPTDNLPHN